MLRSMRKRFQQWRRSARNHEAAAYDSYTQLAAYPLFLMGMLFLVAFVITLTPNAPAVDLHFARVVMPLTWLAFAIDYVISLLISPGKWHYIKTHPLQLAALLFPPLRVLLLGHIFHVLRTAPIRRGDRARTYVLYLTTLLLVLGAVLVVYFESRDPQANINSFGDALWWGGETVSTVGYGDFYPVTVGGRLVAAVLFVNGVALLSIITAGLAQNFTSDDAKGNASDTAGQPGEAGGGAAAGGTAGQPAAEPGTLAGAAAMAILPVPDADLQALHERMDRLEQMLGRVADRIDASLTAQAAEAGQTDTPGTDTPGSAPTDP
jgi:voltage-gated potassium channel